MTLFSPPAAKRPRLLLLLSSGWAVRNYVRSGFLEQLDPHFEIVLGIPSGDAGFEAELTGAGRGFIHVPRVTLPPAVAHVNALLVHSDNARLDFWDQPLIDWVAILQPRWKRPYHRLRPLIARALAWRPVYEALRARERRWLAGQEWQASTVAAFDAVAPDVVMSTSPFELGELPFVSLASRRGVKTLTTLVSWDHLTHRGRWLGDYDHYMVWSPLMADDLRRHRPDIPADRITIVGSPQFDFHVRKDCHWSREAFFARVGLDPSRPLITYGSEAVEWNFPDEPEVVARLWQAIEDGRIAGRPQLLVRLHPHDLSDRFERLIPRCPGLVVSRPWRPDPSRYWWFTPQLDDLALLANTMRYSDLTINLASSLTLDAAIFDRPVINVAFTTTPEDPRASRVPYTHLGAHYKRIVERGAVRLVFTFDELIAAVDRYMRDPSSERGGRRAAVEAICGLVDGGAARRTADAVLAQAGIVPATRAPDLAAVGR